MKKSHHPSAGTSSPKAKRRFRLIEHPFLALAGTWVFFALLAAISLEILVHPTGDRRVAVEATAGETTASQVKNPEFDFPVGLYGAIALICTGSSILVYRRYQRKFGSATPLKTTQTRAKARNRRIPPQPQPVSSPVMAQSSNTIPTRKTAPVPPKTRSRRRKPERLPMTSDGYAPRPLQRQTAMVNRSEVTVIPPPRATSGKSKSQGLVEAMDVRNQQSLDSILGER
ncbi:hypothetical protein [Merismopedia glauca]|uniref:Transmembrane protein n=1 Tax=Merismopedia glauca CCAP 1448/3 TaxID=1296344 RepID=A0A2T1C562_9CYAN|nr:hypothetical protein [Merismopedia glauca]PSB03364.1 hypothetical protein C7B64_08915 [Merismopedia glauca CCAP 1448/3]